MLDNLKSYFPFMVACYIVLTGCFFLLAPLFGSPFEAKLPNRHALTLTSAILLISGIVYGVFAYKGRLEAGGKTIVEVRLEAIEKMDTKSFVAKLAAEDPIPEVREKAKKRLEELSK